MQVQYAHYTIYFFLYFSQLIWLGWSGLVNDKKGIVKAKVMKMKMKKAGKAKKGKGKRTK
jgi:hypothetical protein